MYADNNGLIKWGLWHREFQEGHDEPPSGREKMLAEGGIMECAPSMRA
jgi:hypothetical protein